MKELLNFLSRISNFLREKREINFADGGPEVHVEKTGKDQYETKEVLVEGKKPKPTIDLSGKDAQEKMLAQAEEEAASMTQSFELGGKKETTKDKIRAAEELGRELKADKGTEELQNKLLARLDNMESKYSSQTILAKLLKDAAGDFIKSGDPKKLQDFAKVVDTADYEYNKMKSGRSPKYENWNQFDEGVAAMLKNMISKII